MWRVNFIWYNKINYALKVHNAGGHGKCRFKLETAKIESLFVMIFLVVLICIRGEKQLNDQKGHWAKVFITQG